MKILFLHGWTSTPGGVKPTYLNDRGHTVLNPALPDEDFEAAVRIAQGEFSQHHPDVVVGSSRGGAVAMNMDSGTTPLVLLCPAWKRWGTATSVKPGTVILHSRADDVVPFADTLELLRNSGLDESALIVVGNDHRLADPEPLAAMAEAVEACGERIVGSDFGVPASAGQQAKKIILIEAIRIRERSYAIRPTGRNERLVRSLEAGAGWKASRRGWTVPELVQSLAADSSVTVAAFDFPFSIPVSLLNDHGFAGRVGKEAFCRRKQWAEYIGDNLRLTFASDHAKSQLVDLARFNAWRDKQFWKKRMTDAATGGSPPLKHKYQNVFSMTLAGTAMLESLSQKGFSLALSSAVMPKNGRVAFETYPSAVADHCGFVGSYKKEPERCLREAEGYLAAQGISLDFAASIKKFCLEYRTHGKSKDDLDPDGADAFLCLVAAVCFREGIVSLCSDGAPSEVLAEEGCIIAPVRLTKDAGHCFSAPPSTTSLSSTS